MHTRAVLVCAAALCCLACSETEPDEAVPAADAGTTDVPKKWPATPVPPLFIGSGGFGFSAGSCFPGAAAPQGLAKVGPDTKGPWGTSSFLHFSGYWYGDDIVQGFSHLHLHGTGATDYGVLGIMPSDGFDAGRTTRDGYESPFDKQSERATPGLYALRLERGDIDVEITATAHGAHHRYAYPSGATSGWVIVDLDHHLDGGSVESAEVTLLPAENRFRGRLRSVGGMSGGFGGYDVFFEARTKQPWAASQVWHSGAPEPAAGTEASGTGVGFVLEMDVSNGEPVEVQVALSFVSLESAAANLAAELPSFSFDETADKTAGDWQALLDTVRVEGGTAEQRDMMTAAVYHAFLMPTVTSDVDGSYRAPDDVVRVADGFRYVSDLSLWDTYRTLHPLYAMIAPDRALDAVRSLHEHAKASGFFPKWPIATGEAGTMLGSSAEVVLGDAWARGIRDFDVEGAYAILRAAAMDEVDPPAGRGGRGDVVLYMKHGYVPASRGRSVSMTTEYAVDDLGLAVLAEAVGQDADAAALRDRARGWRKLFDPETGLLWGKNEDGTWSSAHTDPTAFMDEYAEANAWQSAWMVAGDAEGLAELHGGADKAVAKLEELFVLARTHFEELDPEDTLRVGMMRPYYWHGNEPDMNAAYLFAQLGRPDLTQKWVAWVRDCLYGPGADGLAGNDDGGTLSAWYVYSALGFYPIAGSDLFVVGAPLFPRAEIAVVGGTFTVEAPEVSSANLYVQSVELDGEPLDEPLLRQSELTAGGSLVFHMGASPSAWGRAP